MIKIVILDDDEAHLSLIEGVLIGPNVVWTEPVQVKKFNNSLDFFVHLKKETIDCVILDRCLPDLHGDLVLQCIRSHDKDTMSVLMLTSIDETEDKAKLLCEGADDYLTKPFNPNELLIRVRHLVELSRLRLLKKLDRSHSTKKIDDTKNKTKLHGFIFDDFAQTVTLSDQVVALTDREYRLSKFFFNNVGVNLSKKEIIQSVFMDNSAESDRSLVTHVHLIREKLNLKIENGWVLRSIYGFGYCLTKSSL